MGTTMEDIKTMPKITLKKLVKTKVSENAFKYLISKKKSKTKVVPHENLIMQEYLEANDGVIYIAEKKFLFQCRSRTLDCRLAKCHFLYTIQSGAGSPSISSFCCIFSEKLLKRRPL